MKNKIIICILFISALIEIVSTSAYAERERPRRKTKVISGNSSDNIYFSNSSSYTNSTTTDTTADYTTLSTQKQQLLNEITNLKAQIELDKSDTAKQGRISALKNEIQELKTKREKSEASILELSRKLGTQEGKQEVLKDQKGAVIANTVLSTTSAATNLGATIWSGVNLHNLKEEEKALTEQQIEMERRRARPEVNEPAPATPPTPAL